MKIYTYTVLSLNKQVGMKLVLVSLFFMMYLTSMGQDTLGGLFYNGESERANFLYLSNGEQDYFELFMGANSDIDPQFVSDSKKKLEAEIAALKSQNISKKSEKKQAKIIYEAIHNAFFKQYDYENKFEDVFKEGLFNCVSASAIYAFVFEGLAIPYIIVEQPNHVYLVAWPGEDGIIIESTEPTNGSYTISNSNKEKYVKQLLDAKIISKEKHAGMSLVEIYNSFSQGKNKVIDMRQLLSIQYANYGYYEGNTASHEEALNYFEKAMWISPDSTIGEVLNQYRAMYLTDRMASPDSVFIHHFARWAQDSLNELTTEDVKLQYFTFLGSMLAKEKEYDRGLELSHQLFSLLNDSALVAEMRFALYCELGRLYSSTFEFEKAFQYIDSALKAGSITKDLESVLVFSLVNSFKEMSEFTDMIKICEAKEALHPQLQSNEQFQAIKGELCLRQAYRMIMTQKGNAGLVWIKKFEEIVPHTNVMLLDGNLIAGTYSEAVGVLFVQGKKSQARKMVDMGLSLSPYSTELMMRRSALN